MYSSSTRVDDSSFFLLTFTQQLIWILVHMNDCKATAVRVRLTWGEEVERRGSRKTSVVNGKSLLNALLGCQKVFKQSEWIGVMKGSNIGRRWESVS